MSEEANFLPRSKRRLLPRNFCSFHDYRLTFRVVSLLLPVFLMNVTPAVAVLRTMSIDQDEGNGSRPQLHV